jgi:hypothetical protein
VTASYKQGRGLKLKTPQKTKVKYIHESKRWSRESGQVKDEALLTEFCFVG